MLGFNVFVSNTKVSSPRQKTGSSPAPKVFISSTKRVCHKRLTRLSAVDVGSIDYIYLVTSHKHVSFDSDIEVKQVAFQSWFRNPLKSTEIRQK